MSLEQLIRLREGQFQFSLSEAPPRKVGARDISDETLQEGINPQELLLDLARGMDEDRRDSSEALEAGFSEPPAPPPEAVPAAEPRAGPPAEPGPEHDARAAEAAPPPALPEHIPLSSLPPEYTVPMHTIPEALLRSASPQAAPPGPAASPAAAPAPTEGEAKALLLVDDEEDVRRILAQAFTKGGFQVVEAEDPDAAMKKASRLSKAGIEFLLVTDLGMPSSGGSSFQGGFEVVKRLVKMKLDPPVLMMTETLSQAVRARAKQMGISSFVFKPSLSKLDPEQHRSELQAFAEKLLKDVIPTLKKHGRAAPGKKAAAPAAAAPVGGSKDLRALQQYLAELEGSPDATRISTLVMKVAREFFERAVLFLIKGDEVCGLGGFGPAGAGESLNLIARELRIPLSQPSVFLDVVSNGKPYYGEPPEGKWSRYLIGRLGRFRSGAMTLVPLVAHREAIAILFGDNPETGRNPERLEAFFVFMRQAGIAMENALLQRKLRAMQEKG
jgi:CheY-like chemotaxis protein